MSWVRVQNLYYDVNSETTLNNFTKTKLTQYNYSFLLGNYLEQYISVLFYNI